MISDRELQIAELVIAYKENKEIAAELNISVRTVKFHVSNILNKLCVPKRAMITRERIEAHQEVYRIAPLRREGVIRLRRLLSPLEVKVESLMEEGFSNSEIARELNVSRNRAQNLSTGILRKLAVVARIELSPEVVAARENEFARSQFSSLLEIASNQKKVH